MAGAYFYEELATILPKSNETGEVLYLPRHQWNWSKMTWGFLYSLKRLCECGFVEDTVVGDGAKNVYKCPVCDTLLNRTRQRSLGTNVYESTLEERTLYLKNDIVIYQTPYRIKHFDLRNFVIRRREAEARVEIDIRKKELTFYREYPIKSSMRDFNPFPGIYPQGRQGWTAITRQKEDLSQRLWDYWNRLCPEWPIHNVPKDYLGRAYPFKLQLLALSRFMRYPQLTLLTREKYLDPFYRSIWQHRLWDNAFDLTKTNPREILGLTKAQFEALKLHWETSRVAGDVYRGDYIRKKYNVLKRIEKSLGVHYTTRLFQRWKQWTYTYANLVETLLAMGLDPNKLGSWMISHPSQKRLKSELTSLRDTFIMARALNQDISHLGIRRILELHDELIIAYRLEEDALKREMMKLAYERNMSLEYQVEEYQFMIPQEFSDFTRESQELHHCVSSYAEGYVDGETIIVMMRKKGKPCITIEVRDKRVVQVKGEYNRAPSADERKLVKEWAKVKKLHY